MSDKKFSMDDYVDVAERIRVFHEKYPEGSLQSSLTYMADPAGWFAVARAYRTADDVRPGVGHAFEPVPGKTPYTRDSEAMNAETSAWGRAIVALGFETKKIASAQEVNARADTPPVKQPRQRSRKPTNSPLPPPPDDDPGLLDSSALELQKNKIGELLQTKKIGDPGEQRSFVYAVIGREIKTRDDLTFAEARKVITKLELFNKNDPETWPFETKT